MILEANPSFSVEHIRDTFRFKVQTQTCRTTARIMFVSPQAVVFSFRDALKVVSAMDSDRSLCPNGLTVDSVAKLDIAKLRKPKEWG